ncbi:uroplakin-3b-like [Phyllobates terribilis]|uniref:uroplakin-3b-like n=1 Tax=Phyllobates terribilis TaxID=111132 RepID=UPI003CCB31B5
MQSCRTAMWCLAILVILGASTVHGQVTLINCPPTLVSSDLLGRITSSTFTIQALCCLVQNHQILSTDNVVILVGLSNVIRSLIPTTIDINNPPLYSNFSQSGLFAAANFPAGSLCPLQASVGGIQFGSNILCLTNPRSPFCNGPLSGGPLSVTVLVYRNGTLIAVTDPSADISLKTPANFRSIDTSVKTRSASMIVITVILPILFALLLVILTTMLFLKCCCCRVFTPSKCQQES